MPIDLPEPLAHRYSGWTVEVAWKYKDRATTWRLSRGSEAHFAKLLGPDAVPGAAAEAARMRWAAPYIPVPEVLDVGRAGSVRWLLTRALPGLPSVHPSVAERPGALVQSLAAALRRIHALPVQACPFDFRLDAALAHVGKRVRSGLVHPGDLHEETGLTSPEAALAELHVTRPAAEDLVVCHGDVCPPNFLFDDDLHLTGVVDLGELGVADRWFDLTIACWSIGWNLGEEWVDPFLTAYGIAPDPARMRFYGILYDLAS